MRVNGLGTGRAFSVGGVRWCRPWAPVLDDAWDTVITAAPSLDVTSASRDMSLRWILLTCPRRPHATGHIDLLREQADGGTGEQPTT